MPIPEGTITAVKMGNTVASSALLERKGQRTALFITLGFADLLRIGYQNRRRLFDLHIRLPELLCETAVEVDERGTVLVRLDDATKRADLQVVYNAGIRSVAVALMHGFRFTDHEVRIGVIGREVGFTQISLSHQTSPLIKLVSRGDTTVVDAYLSPILRRYVEQVAGALSGSRLMFMQSSGGLTDAALFQGKDAILSGPAGGGTEVDCNMLLGKLQADVFPPVFGPNGDQPLDVDVVRAKFATLRDTIDPTRSVEQNAEGFLRITVENMANVIKKISVQRGDNVTTYTMNCFDGAGRQHACLDANALGMTSVFIHPLAGVLSAFGMGMGMADIRAIRERQMSLPLAEVAQAETALAEITADARTEVEGQDIGPANIDIVATAHIRTDGAQQTLEVPFGSVEAMTAGFAEAHVARFGFAPPTGNLVANAPHVPVHLGSMAESVRTVLRLNAGDIRPGDVFMMNNPCNGGTHLPDVPVITAVFHGERIAYTIASRGQHAAIGGTTSGSTPPDSSHIDQEGVLIDNFRMVRAGVMQDDATRALLASGPYPCRNVDQNMADLAAQIAANTTAQRELGRITAQFGADAVAAYMTHVQGNAEESVRPVLDVLKKTVCTPIRWIPGRRYRWRSGLIAWAAAPLSTLPAHRRRTN